MNEKFRESISGWTCFDAKPDNFGPFFERVLELRNVRPSWPAYPADSCPAHCALAWAGGRQHVQSGPSLAAPVFRLLRVAWPLTTDVVRGTRHVRGMYAATRYAACTRHVRGTLSGR